MMKLELKKTQKLIKSLTNNEDYQQELWVAHLSGQHHLPTILQNIHTKQEQIERFQAQLHKLDYENNESLLGDILDNFKGMERSVLYYIILGYNVKEISVIYGTCLIKIEQAISVIRQHESWEKLLQSV